MSAPHATLADSRAPAWARRGYAALVVGLAVFLGLLIVLREPVRGYLATIRLAGPLPAGQEPAELAAWIEAAAVGVRAKVSASELYPGDCQIELEHLGPRPQVAQTRLEDLAQQFIGDYLPTLRTTGRQTRLARLQAEVQAARDQEDLLRVQLETLRQQQLLAMSQALQPQQDATVNPSLDQANLTALASDSTDERTVRLEALRKELAKLLAGFTDEHPQVIALRSQIARLEEQLAQPQEVSATDNSAALPSSTVTVLVSTTTRSDSIPPEAVSPAPSGDDLSDDIDAALTALAAATRNREWSEGQL
jgi:hypothetical protein